MLDYNNRAGSVTYVHELLALITHWPTRVCAQTIKCHFVRESQTNAKGHFEHPLFMFFRVWD